MTSIEEIASTLRNIAAPGMKPKAIRAAVRKRHPEASKKDIVRAAFFAVTEGSSANQDGTPELHNFALAERVAEDNAEVVLLAGKRKKKKHSSGAAGKSRAL
ncbi:hypothetical protein [Methylobacterium sp. SI9]|uniref:hypothetical protein n=1 Tax=Methylobacterium guangdongense TaxID=3138811 RepID=UPI00313BA78A